MTAATFRSMGCEVAVGGATPRELTAVRNLFAERERVFSRFRADSELRRVNAASGRLVVVSRGFAAMLELALAAAAQTDGLVDPTLGRAIVAAGYDRDFALLGDDPEPTGATSGGRWYDVRLAGRIVRVPPGVELDLNGVVKSRTVDDALELLAGDGFVSAGGDVAARGGVDVAVPGGESVRIVRGGLATSGSDRRRWRRGGEPQHHLIDSSTGRPSVGPWSQVTVSGRTCLAADVAAKAAFLLGAAGPAWLDEHAIPGRFRDDAGTVVPNESWRRSLAEAACT